MTDFWHENGKYFTLQNMVETSDDCLIVECPMFEGYMYDGPDIGVMFYKISKEGTMTDSLLLEIRDVQLRTFFESDPDHPDSYVFAFFEKADDTLFFRMKTIDKDLNIIGGSDLVIDQSPQLEDYYSYDMFQDPGGDIIASYSLNDIPNGFFMTHFLRIGLDGTLKGRREMPEMRRFDKLLPEHTGVLSKTPLRYCYWGSNWDANNSSNPPIRLYVLDSLFNVVDEKPFYFYGGTFYTSDWQEHFAPLDDQHYLNVNTHYWLDSNYYVKTAVLIEKRNMDHTLEAAALFGENRQQPAPIRATAVDGNTVYLSYMTRVMYDNQLVLLRLDGDMNVVWECRFLSENMFHCGTCMEVLKDGSIAVGSYKNIGSPYPSAELGGISVVVFKDSYDALEEQGFTVRPYAYWPNPAQDQLHLQYSPDVTPQQIELYDLQGRLVRSQRNGLESVNLEGLAAGAYTMRVTLDDGKTFTDKVVKE